MCWRASLSLLRSSLSLALRSRARTRTRTRTRRQTDRRTHNTDSSRAGSMDTSSVAASTRLVGNHVGRNLINIYRSNIYICKTGVKQEKSIYTCIYIYI
jgi:hypothetical protein